MTIKKDTGMNLQIIKIFMCLIYKVSVPLSLESSGGFLGMEIDSRFLT